MPPELPYHRWPRSYGGWQAGSLIRCEGHDCQWCEARWPLVHPRTLKDMPFPARRSDRTAVPPIFPSN